jgi:hypothetical protein
MEEVYNKKDNIFTIDLPGSDLVFTRYLYVKDEVRIALLVSILNKSDDAIFWAYELYYSGFKNELLGLIWKIYYDFFATLNPSFEQYLMKKHKEILLDQDRVVSAVIQTLLFRPFNTDIFMLRNIVENFETDIVYNDTNKIKNITEATNNLKKWVLNNDYRCIAEWIYNINNNTINIVDIYNICLDIFEELGIKLTKPKLIKDFVTSVKNNMNPNVNLLSKIMCLFSKKEHLKKGKSIYINVEPEDIIIYETICGSYKILEKVCICGIDDFKHLSLFKLKRSKYNLVDKYLYNWEYHASFSPLWSERIKQFGGYPDYMKQKIMFKEEPDDDLMQEFYSLYGLEPDEQLKSIQEKSIKTIEKVNNWKLFKEKYKKNGLFDIYEEELDEFDISGLLY